MATSYIWTSRDTTFNIAFYLEDEGIAIEAPNGKSFEPYSAIRGIQLTPAMTRFGAVTAIWLDRKQMGLAVTIGVRGSYPPADANQVSSYNHWVKTLHATLIDRQLAGGITFQCGTQVSRWGWIASVYPVIRVTALVLVPVGLVAAFATGAWAFAVACVGGGAAMLMMPKISKPDVPEDLRRIRSYSPEAIPEGCLAQAPTVGL